MLVQHPCQDSKEQPQTIPKPLFKTEKELFSLVKTLGVFIVQNKAFVLVQSARGWREKGAASPVKGRALKR